MEAILTSFLGSIPLRDEALTIGRAPRNGLFINNATVSRRHAEIHPTERGYYIVDLESTSGTFINGRRLTAMTPYLLQTGDAIQVGDFALTYNEKPMLSSVPVDAMTTLPITGPSQLDRPPSEANARSASGVDHQPTSGDVVVATDILPLSPVSDEQLSVTPLSDGPYEIGPAASAPSDADALATTLKFVPGERLVDLPTEPVPQRTMPDVEAALPGEQAASIDLAHQILQCTAFYARTVPVGTWQTLLVYAHIDKALEMARVDARRLRDQLAASPLSVDADMEVVSLAGDGRLPITVLPVFQGITFQPERAQFFWTDEWHPAAFRFSADADWEGAIGTGEVLLLAGPVIIAALRIPLHFVASDSDAAPELDLEEISVTRYARIFASYSHNDTAIVESIRQVYQVLGDDSFQDIEQLRSNQNWHSALQRAIESADVFQLFWSPHSAQELYVYQECQYALQHYKYEGFVRPIYWQKPLGFLPPELSHLYFTYYALPAT